MKSKADIMFEELGMKRKESQHIVNGEIVEHIIKFKKETSFEEYITCVVFNILGKNVTYKNQHQAKSVEIIVATYEKMKELGWL